MPSLEEMIEQVGGFHPAQPLAVSGSQGSADEAGQAIGLSQDTGVPSTVINSDLKAFGQELKAKQAAASVTRNPAAAAYVEKTPLAAQVSNDDWANLDKIKETLDNSDRAVMEAAYNGWKTVTNYDPAKESGFLKGFTREYEKGGPLGLSPQNQLDFPNFYLAWNWLLAAGDATFRFPFAVGAGLGEMIREKTGSEAAAREAENFLRWQFTGQARIAPPVGEVPRISRNVDEFLKNAESLWNTEKGRAARTEIDEFIRTKETAANEPQLKLLPAPKLTGAAEVTERIIYPAVKIDGKVYTGAFHPEAFENAAKELGVSIDVLAERTGKVKDEFQGETAFIGGSDELDGFVTSTGRFVDRKEAMKIAEKQDQLDVKGGDSLAADQLKGWEDQDVESAARIDAAKPKPINPVADRMARNGQMPHSGLDKSVDQMKLDLSKADSASFDRVFNQVQESLTQQRSPVAMEAYLQEVFGPKKIWVSPQVLLDLYKSGVPAKGDGLFGYVEDLEKQLTLARDTGVDLQIPVSAYMAWTDPAVHSQIKDQIRFREGQPTKEEGKEFIEVYHGSPVRFEAFDSTFMGTGEGAQAYAYGHYLAENRLVAEEYAKKLSLDSMKSELIESIASNEADIRSIMDDPQSMASPKMRDELDTLTAIVEADKKKLAALGDGNVYRAQIKGRPEDFLDWDAPLQEQPQFRERLLKAAEKLQLDSGELAAIRGEKTDQITGAELYEKLKRLVGNEAASKALSGAGIPGVRFLDQGSRGLVEELKSAREFFESAKANPTLIGEALEAAKNEVTRLENTKETRNYVVFSNADIKITHINDIQLSPEAKRLLETPAAQIALEAEQAEKASLYLHPLFDNGKAVNITEAEFKKYSKLIEKADQATFDKAVAAARRQIAKQQTEEWKREEARTLEEVQSDLRSRPDIAADRYFREGMLPTGERVPKVKLDKEAVEAIVGKGALKDLVREDGASPDDFADILGFPSGTEMIKAMDLLEMTRKSTGEGPKAYLNRITKEITEQRMFDQYGELEQNILAEARDAALSTQHIDILAAEMAILARAAGGEPPLSREGIEQWVKDRYNQIPIDQASRYENFRKATEKGGREAEKALLKGDFVKAFQAKQRQLLSFLMAKEARALARDIARAHRDWSRLEKKTVANIDPAFMDQIHRVLDQIGWGNKRNPAELANALQGKPLKDFVEAYAAEGWEFSIPDFLLDPAWRKATEDLTTEEFRAVKDAVRTLEHVGKESQFVTVEGKKIAFEELKTEIIANLKTLPRRDMSANQKIRFMADALMTKQEILYTDYDLGDPLGPFTTAVFRPAKEAQLKESNIITEVSKKIKGIKGTWKWRRSLNEQVAQDFLIDPSTSEPFKLRRGDVINIALNMGNRENIDILTRAYSGDVSGTPKPYSRHLATRLEFQLRGLINRTLTENDWQYINKIWEVFKDLWPQANELYRDVSGIGLNPREVVPFETPFGTQPGGYFPIIHDPMRSATNVIKERNPLEMDYVRATTANGYSKKLTGYVDYIDIQRTPEHLVGRIQQQVHDIAFRRAIIDIGKIIYDKEIRAAIRLHYGPEYEAKLNPWLQYIANRYNIDDVAVKDFNWLLRTARQNLVYQALGFNYNVIFSPDMGTFFNPSNYATFATFARHPVREWNLALEKSKELPQTMANADRDFHEQFNDLARRMKWDTIRGNVAYASMWPAAKFSQVFRTITFLKNYREALAEGKSEADAIFIGDNAVREFHGAHSRVDLPPLFRSNEGIKMLTMFQGYFNSMYNWQRGIKKNLEEGEWREAMSALFGVYIVGAAFNLFLFGRFNEDDGWGERMAKSLTMQSASLIPGLGMLANYILEGNDARFPLMSIMKGVTDAGADAVALMQGRTRKKMIQHWINVPGYLFGLPTGQVAKSAQFMTDVKNRRQYPRTFGEWIRGIRTGEAKEKSR